MSEKFVNAIEKRDYVYILKNENKEIIDEISKIIPLESYYLRSLRHDDKNEPIYCFRKLLKEKSFINKYIWYIQLRKLLNKDYIIDICENLEMDIINMERRYDHEEMMKEIKALKSLMYEKSD